MKKVRSSLYIVLCLIFLTGCWDRVEINKRLFVTSIGVDLTRSEEKPYQVTYEIPNLGKWKDALDNKGDNLKFTRVQYGSSFYQASNEINANIPGKLYYGYTRVAILSTEFLKNEKLVKQLFEGFERNNEVDRGMYLLATEGQAKDIVSLQPQIVPYTGIYIQEIFKGIKNNDFLKITTLENAVQELKSTGTTLIPLIRIMDNQRYLVSGAALMIQYKYYESLTSKQLIPILLLTNEVKSGVINIESDGINIPIEISNISTKFKVSMEGDTLVVRPFIIGEGEMHNYTYQNNVTLLDPKNIEFINRKANEVIQQEVERTIYLMQNDWKVDITRLKEYIRKHEPDIYDRVSKDWEHYYTRAKILPQVDIQIRRVGIIK